MDLKHLVCFLEVAECKNFSVAAKKLHYSVSTVTQYVRMLEEELGFELLKRSSRPLALTDAGRYFYEKTSELPSRLNHIIENAKKLALDKPGRLIVGFSGEDADLLSLVKRHFRQEYPGYLLTFREIPSHATGDALKKGICDVYFGMTDPEFHQDELRQTPLVTVKLCCRVPKDHPLIKRAMIRFEDLDGEDVAIISSGTHVQQQNFEMRFYEACPRICTYLFANHREAAAYAKAQNCILLSYEHLIREELPDDCVAIDFEWSNENSYSLTTRVIKNRMIM